MPNFFRIIVSVFSLWLVTAGTQADTIDLRGATAYNLFVFTSINAETTAVEGIATSAGPIQLKSSQSSRPQNPEVAVAKSDLLQLSQTLSNYATTGKTIPARKTLTLEGDCSSKLQVFTITTSEIGKASSVNLRCIPESALVVVNLTGSALAIEKLNLASFSTLADKVLFNAPSALTLKITASDFHGSLLAPSARVTLTGGSFSGQLISDTFYGSATLHNIPFQKELVKSADTSAPVTNASTSTSHLNAAPDCSQAVASPKSLWPVNHKFQKINFLGVTDPNGDPLDLRVKCIFQDEPLNSLGDGTTEWDADGIYASSALVRAERSGTGNGRVYHIEFEASDPSGESCRGKVTVGVPHSRNGSAVDEGRLYQSVKSHFDCHGVAENHAPTITSPPTTTATANLAYHYQVMASDLDGDALTYTLDAAPVGMTIDATSGAIDWLPGIEQIGSVSVEVLVKDGRGGSDTQHFTISVADQPNRSPVITSTPATQVVENDVYIYKVVATDPDDDILTLSLVNAPTNVVLDAATQELRWATVIGDAGTYPVTLRVDDGSGGVAEQSFVLTITTFNLSPEITSEPITIGVENALYTYLVQASDRNNDALVYSLENAPTGMTIDSQTGSIQWTPSFNDAGSYPIGLVVSDQGGLTTTQTYTLTIGNTNRPPMFVASPVPAGEENVAFSYQANVLDADGDTLVFGASNELPDGLVINSANGNVSWLPSYSQAGEYSITLTATDGQATATHTINITITNVNRAPTVTGEHQLNTPEDNALTITLEGNDPDGDSISYSMPSLPSHGTLTGSAPTLVYTPDANFNGVDSFQFYISDGSARSALTTVNIAVAAVNDAPVAQAISTNVVAGAPVAIALSGTDIEGEIRAYQISSEPSHGSLSGTPPNLVYTSDALFSGTDTFTYTVSDGEINSSPATVNVNVLRANLAPRITSSPVLVGIEGGEYRYPVLVEDSEGDEITLQLLDAPNGLSIDTQTQTLVWEHPEIGTYSVAFVAIDQEGLQATQTYELQILQAQPPVTTQGQDFWVMFNIRAKHPIEEENLSALYASSTDRGTLHVVSPALDIDLTFALEPNEVLTIDLSDILTEEIQDALGIQPYGIHVTSDVDMSLYLVNQSQHSSDASLVLPAKALGYTYYAGSYTNKMSWAGNLGWAFDNFIGVVATEDNTIVTVNPAESLRDASGSSEIKADQYQITLNRGESYQAVAPGGPMSFSQEVTGTLVTADKPIALFSGSKVAGVADNYGDHLVEQMPPVTSWGSRYHTLPLATRFNGDTFRIVASQPNTYLTINDTVVARLNSGEFYETVINEPALIIGSHPILVLQFSNGELFDGGKRPINDHNADPFMVVVPPVEQFLSHYNITTPADLYSASFVNLIAPRDATDSIRIDGHSVTSSLWVTTADPDFVGAQIPISVGQHTISGDQPFGLYVYGFAPFESYGYIGGMALAENKEVASLTVSIDQNEPHAGERLCLNARLADADNNSITQTQVLFKRHYSGLVRDYAELSDATGNATLCYSAQVAGVERWEVQAQAVQETLNIPWLASASSENLPPQFISLPELHAVPAQAYRYPTIARDPNEDTLRYSVIEGPAGLAINAETGVVEWAAPANFQEAFVTLQVSDGVLSNQQRYRLISTPGANHPPVFTSVPITRAITGRTYTYVISASDADNHPVYDNSEIYTVGGISDDARSYQLLNGPDGLVLTHTQSRYRLEWVVTNTQVGDHPVSIQVTDSHGASTTQDFVISVELNQAPVFTSLPTPNATALHNYYYYYSATDANADSIKYSLASAPPGMVIVSAGSFNLRWAATSAQVGTHRVVLQADDQFGGVTQQAFDITVTPNQAPVFTSVPKTTAVVGRQYQYATTVTDAEGDNLTYSVVSGPDGLRMGGNSVAWTPTASQIGNHTVVIAANDRLGGYTEQSYSITVHPNYAPQFTSKPVYGAKVGKNGYSYTMTATDANGDAISYRRVAGPFGMQLSANVLRWEPALANVGVHNVTMEAYDPYGGASQQSFTVTVINGTLEISHYPNNATLVSDEPFSFFVEAIHPTNLPVQFALTQAPTGMTLDGASGLLQWTPTEAQVGMHAATLRAYDNEGREDVVNFNLEVRQNTNQAPVFNSLPPTVVDTGATYSYTASATDPEGHTIQYSLTQSPTGMNLTGATIEWLPTDAQEGIHEITLRATDERGRYSEQHFTITVGVNHAPEILGTPFTSAAVGYEYTAHLQGHDVDGDALTFAVHDAPEGLSVGALDGMVRWTPSATQVGDHRIGVTLSDGQNSIVVSWTIHVTADVVPLAVDVSISPRVIAINEEATIAVVTTGGVAESQVSLTVNGAAVTLDSQGRAVVTGTSIGRYDVVVSASDGSQTTTINTYFSVADPSDTNAPHVALLTPASSDTITAPTAIVGTVQDDSLVDVRLAYRRAGTEQWVDLYRGTDGFDASTIALFDPTVLLNGTYHLILEATDSNGLTSSSGVAVVVDGDLKVGNFSFTVEDLALPMSGIPIRVTRTYDSRRRSEALDFGYGWSIGYQDVRIEESTEPTEGWHQVRQRMDFTIGSSQISFNATCIYPLREKFVTVTLPNGDVERFSVHARIEGGGDSSDSDADCFMLGGRNISLEFRPDENTQSTLTTNDADNLFLTEIEGGNLSLGDSIDVAVPVSRYQLTTRAGYIYDLNQNFGITKVTDPNGHTLTYTDAGIYHSDGRSVVFGRDGQGRIHTITDPKQNVITYNYNPEGELESVVEANLATTRYTYFNDHGLDEIIDPLQRRLIKNIYNAAGRLTSQEDGQGRVKTFDHDLDENSSVVTDRDGRTTVLNYDNRGNVREEIIKIADGLYSGDITTSYSYDENDNQETKTVGAAAYTWVNDYDEQNNLLFTQDPEGNRVDYLEYNARGQETQIQDEMDRLTVMHYDVAGNLYKIDMPALTDPDTGTVSNLSAGNGINLRGQVEQTTDLRGLTTHYTYYPSGHVWDGQKHTESNSIAGTKTFTYDDNLNVKTETRQRTVNGSVISETLTYDYDARNRLTITTYPDGTYTETQYDLAGKPDLERDRFGQWTDYTYDEYGRLRETIYPDTSRETRTYTHEGLLRTVTDRMNHTTTYEYDDAGRLWKTTFHDGTFTETRYTLQGWVRYQWDENRNLTEYEYDLAGKRRAMIRYLDGRAIRHEFTYYPTGELHTETDALGRTTTYDVNAFDQRIETRYVNGTSIGQRYDAMGARTRSIDQNSIATRFRNDLLGRLEGVQPDVNINNVPVPETQYSYDQVGNKLTQTDANGHTTRWTYDYFGRVLSRTLPEGEVETFVYDDAAHTLTHTDFNGQTITTTYDVMGQVDHIDYSNGASENYSYYFNGLLQTVTDKNGTTEYGYDNRDRLQWLIQPDGVRIDYDYDDVGNRTLLRVTREDVVTTVDYTYDDLNRLETVTDASGRTTYAYYDTGSLHTVTYPNGVVTTYTYNVVNQLETVTTRDGSGNVISGYTYGLDNTGRRDTITEANGRFTDNDYDDLYRLTGETITDSNNGNYSATYRYDWVGNRTYSIVNGVHTSFAYNDNDQLESQGGVSYTFDDNGNLKTETEDGVVTTYFYDEKNQLTSVEKGGVTTGYTYNHNGIRTGKTEGGQTTTYVVDENRDYAQVIEEVVGSTTTAKYTYGLDLINQQRDGQLSYYQFDGLGSTRTLTDASGQVTDQYNYAAFGELLNSSGDTANEFRYTGERYDSSLDQYYLRARYYDPSVGRFGSLDTFAGEPTDPITLNKYLYANADPALYTDPSGHFGLVEMGIAMNVASILANMQIQSGMSLLDGALGMMGNEEERETLHNAQMLMGIVMLGTSGVQLAKMLSKTVRKACNSFEEDTLVHTEFGLKKIQDIKIGEKVWAYNERTGEQSLETVIHLVEGDGEKTVVDIKLTSGEVIEATSGHPFYIEGDWVDAGELKVGDQLLGLDGERITVSTLSQAARETKVYNLTVANSHTYYVGLEGVLNHNANPNKPCRMPEAVTSASNLNEARNQARNLAQLGGDAVPYLAARPSKTAGKVYSGMQSKDGKRGWRLDYDAEKGMHVNWWRIEDGFEWKGAVKIPGKNQDDYHSALRHFPWIDIW